MPVVFSFAKRYFDCQKTEKSGLEASEGSCPLLTILAIFSLEIWERESAPAELLPDDRRIDDRRFEPESAAEIIGG